MWSYEYAEDTDVDRDALWRTWADVTSWPEWNGGVERVEIDGPFAAGTSFRMVPPGGDEAIEMRLVTVEPGHRFIDEMDDGRVIVTTEHRLEWSGDVRTRVTYRTTVTGPEADELGRAITTDFPDVVAGLVRAAADS